jgi:predicted  nucleic acid-binding Zn-ribbon protein
VKNNKEDSATLAKHASEITTKLVAVLEKRSDLESLRSSVERYSKCVSHTAWRMVSAPNQKRRTLKDIAAFTKERAGRSKWDQMRKKQSDMDEIKKWEKELTRAHERFNVSGECLLLSHSS